MQLPCRFEGHSIAFPLRESEVAYNCSRKMCRLLLKGFTGEKLARVQNTIATQFRRENEFRWSFFRWMNLELDRSGTGLIKIRQLESVLSVEMAYLNESNDHYDKPSLSLLIKRSELASNLQNPGTSCIISQKWMMALSIKATFEDIYFNIQDVDYRNPLPEEIRKKWSISRFPSLLVRWPAHSLIDNLNGSYITNNKTGINEQLLVDSKDIESVILGLPGGPSLCSSIAAEKIIANVYMKFNGLLRSNEQIYESRERALMLELLHINDFLAKNKTDFLCGDHLTLADCDLMPKLQHIRVAGEFYKGFIIPTELADLWNYIQRAYNLQVFRVSCPFDQDIVVHYQNKVLLPKHTLLRPTLQKLSITNTIPSSEVL
ncbi:hypothetical protein GJ496_003341 [Pomphorhynchus laevis]|nr:hypothetical protein GJ496_003341 [Pomphorhynchus laevis]